MEFNRKTESYLEVFQGKDLMKTHSHTQEETLSYKPTKPLQSAADSSKTTSRQCWEGWAG